MISKRTLNIIIFVLVLFLISGFANATTQGSSSVKSAYTADQEACIRKNQLESTKPAQQAFEIATKKALEVRIKALKVAETIKKASDKTAAIKAANDKYNNDETVKNAKAPYIEAFKTARANAIEKCVGTSSGTNNAGNKSFWQQIKGFFGRFGASLRDAVTIF